MILRRVIEHIRAKNRGALPSLFFLLLGCVTLSGCVQADALNTVDADFEPILLNPVDADQIQLGKLRYLGGLHLKAGEHRLGGHSGLRWRDGRLYSVMDDGRWSSFEPVEDGARLTGVRTIEQGVLLGRDGAPLTGKAAGDAESLAIAENGDWLIGFERRHRIERYGALGEPAQPSDYDVPAIFGALKTNNGVEAMATTAAGLFLCAERQADAEPNCYLIGDNHNVGVAINPPAPLDALNATPTDAAASPDGDIYLLFRSYSPSAGNSAAIIRRKPDGAIEPLAIIRPPLSVDNMEGLAIRQDGERTFIYLISDDNFSRRQRTLLMKFEIAVDD